jgi:serine phosphatase RsbU (regulator of sigma subunit)
LTSVVAVSSEIDPRPLLEASSLIEDPQRDSSMVAHSGDVSSHSLRAPMARPSAAAMPQVVPAIDANRVLPTTVLWWVLACSLLPPVWFGVLPWTPPIPVTNVGPEGTPVLPVFEKTPAHEAALFIQTLLQWTGVCLALVTAVCAFTQFSIRREVATPIVGAALLFAGLLDAFQTLGADRLITTVADPAQFIPFTWSLSRLFHAGIVALGTLPFVLGQRLAQQMAARQRRSLAAIAALFSVATFLLIEVCIHLEQLPLALSPSTTIARPWDALALVTYLLAGGILLPRFHRRHASVFSYGLLLSLIPHTLGEAYAAFASRELFDEPFFVAQALKLVGYAVPLAGLLVDLTRVYRREADWLATQEKLRVAREIQKGLLPREAPRSARYDIAGCSRPADAVGGDLFDYLSLPDQRLGLLVADVSGHDLGAAILMSQTRAYLKALSQHSRDPGWLLKELNQFLCRDVRDRRFVSVLLAVLDQTRNTVAFAGAGHVAYIFRATPFTGTAPRSERSRSELPGSQYTGSSSTRTDPQHTDSQRVSFADMEFTHPGSKPAGPKPSGTDQAHTEPITSPPTSSGRRRHRREADERGQPPRMRSNKRKTRHAAARSPSASLVSGSATGAHIESITPDGLLLGVAEVDFPVTPALELAVGDAVLLVTDGWVEATAADGTPFGVERLHHSIVSRLGTSSSQILAGLEHDLFEFRQQRPPDDDLTAVLFRRLT